MVGTSATLMDNAPSNAAPSSVMAFKGNFTILPSSC
jgi:hypothetical protein